MFDTPAARENTHSSRLSDMCFGAAFVAILLLFLSSASHIWASNVNIHDIELSFFTFSQFIPAFVFLGCVLLSYGRRTKKPAMIIWFIMAILCFVVSWSQPHWGDGAADGTEAMRIHYSRYSFLSDSLFAYASLILLLANVALSAKCWLSRTR
jgi:hypothetical protein